MHSACSRSGLGVAARRRVSGQCRSANFNLFGFGLPGARLSPDSQRFLVLLSSNCPGMEIACTEGKRQSKRCFFENKNQKTLTHSGWGFAERPKPIKQKFFASFLQKSRPSCRLPDLRPPTWAVTLSKKNCLLAFELPVQTDHLRRHAVAGKQLTSQPSLSDESSGQ